MKPRSDPGTLVASRLFDHADGKVELSIHQPAPDPGPGGVSADDPPWRCRYTIRFPDGEVRQHGVMGIDAIQALLLALASAGGDLRRHGVQWLGTDDLGLAIAQLE